MRSKKRPRAVIRGMDAVYHLVSRTSCGQFLFGDEEKEVFVRMMRKQAEFCGVDVLAYCMMSNHFHILAKVRHEPNLSDAALLERHRALYGGDRAGGRAIDPEKLESLFRSGGEEAEQWREKLKERMGDVSVFMRELKQRFGIWYNHRHQNRGSIWADRFKSLIVEPSREAMSKVAAYIDLNPVRAELVDDPASYRFCSYGAAMGGQLEARRGYAVIYFGRAWRSFIRSYRIYLYGKGFQSKGERGKDYGRISEEKIEQVLANGGKLEMAEVLRCRVRYFSDGMALGSSGFLKKLHVRHQDWFSEKRKARFAVLKGADWGDLRVVRNLIVKPLG
ncbi:MAG: transposase [Puniceicoccaceae bacterium]